MQHILTIGDGTSHAGLSGRPLRYIDIVDSIATQVADMPARRPQTTRAAARVFCGLGLVMRPNALRIIFGLLLGVLAAFFIGALAPPTPPTKAVAPSSAFAFRFSPALPGWIITR